MKTLTISALILTLWIIQASWFELRHTTSSTVAAKVEWELRDRIRNLETIHWCDSPIQEARVQWCNLHKTR
jgi:hypothetical protein